MAVNWDQAQGRECTAMALGTPSGERGRRSLPWGYRSEARARRGCHLRDQRPWLRTAEGGPDLHLWPIRSSSWHRQPWPGRPKEKPEGPAVLELKMWT